MREKTKKELKTFTFIITGNPISSKNSRPIYVNKSTGSRFVGKSQSLKDYMDKGLGNLQQNIRYGECGGELIRFVYTDNGEAMPIPITSDIEIKFTFYVKDNRKRDLVNLCQAPLDLLQKAGIISDDSIVKSLDGSRIYIDKDNPHTKIFIKIL